MYSFISEHESDGSIAYLFQTKTGTKYRVYFYPACDYSSYVTAYKYLYEFGYLCGFTKVDPDEFMIEPFDAQIKNTILGIFQEFLREVGDETILLYHCDYVDGKQAKRNKMFKKWFSEVRLTMHVFMEDTEIHMLDENGNSLLANYLGYFILDSNPQKHSISIEIQKVKADLVNEK